MAYEVTATRRRPQQFESLAGQEFVVSTLKNAISQGRIAHAYLFSGPRGVGKTTSARLLAKALNCVHGPTAEPCGECDNCRGIAKGSNLDVIEIDGASNTGVNDVRVIKEEVLFPPTSSRYKIYIIDEVHMLSQSAFNALLKTIEEPPEYVVFIFATTETQKVPATIRSRCQQFNFQLIPLETIKRLLGEAAAEMGIEAEDEALFWIAKEATGSMRDAYTLFDQVVAFSNGRITLSQIREKLGLVGVDRINAIMQDILMDHQDKAQDKIHELLAKGVSIDQIIKDFTDYFRSLLLIREGVKSENVLGQQVESFPVTVVNAFNEEQLEAALDMFLKLYRDIRYSLNPRFELELAISKLSKLRYLASNAAVIEQLARLKNDLINGSITPLNPALSKMETVQPKAAAAKTSENAESKAPAQTAAQDAPQSSEENAQTMSSQTNRTEQNEHAGHENPVKVPEQQASQLEAPAAAEVPAPAMSAENAAAETPAPEVPPAPQAEPAPAEPARDSEEAKPSLGPDDLPQGVVAHEFTEDGLVLTFASKFFYKNALTDLPSIREDIQKKLGTPVNVVIAFSEQLEDQRKAEAAQQEAEAQQKQASEEASKTEPEAKFQVQKVNLNDEQKNLISDLMLAFQGREEKK